MDNPGRRLKLVAEKGVKKYQKVGAELSALVKKEMDAGNGRIKIARKLGLSPNTIGKVMERIKSRDGCIARKKGSGRPRSACTPSNIAEISRIVSADPKRSLTKIAGEVGMARSSAHRATRSHLKKKSIRAAKSPNLTETNKASRVEKANEFSRKIDCGRLRVEDIVLYGWRAISERESASRADAKFAHLDGQGGVQNDALRTRPYRRGKALGGQRDGGGCGFALRMPGAAHYRARRRNRRAYLHRNGPERIRPGVALVYGGLGNSTFTQDNAPPHAEFAARC